MTEYIRKEDLKQIGLWKTDWRELKNLPAVQAIELSAFKEIVEELKQICYRGNEDEDRINDGKRIYNRALSDLIKAVEDYIKGEEIK